MDACVLVSEQHWRPHDDAGGTGTGMLHCTPVEIDILAGPSHCDALETINLGSGAEHCTPLSTLALPAKDEEPSVGAEADTGEVTLAGNRFSAGGIGGVDAVDRVAYSRSPCSSLVV